MKILAGELKNRNIQTKYIYRKYTRPIRAIVRKSLFSAIDNVKDKVILDLFCGTGILGIEALSRGAERVFFIDNNKLVIKQLRYNIEKLKLEKCEIFNVDYRLAIKSLKKREIKFDIIFSDPPYYMLEKYDIPNYIIENGLLNVNGILIQTQNSKRKYIHKHYTVMNEKIFGKTKYIILKTE